MAIALVKAGSVSTTASAPTTVTPAFGQATAAGNLLIAHLGVNWNSTTWTAPAGWSVVEDGAWVAIAYKPNCGAGEAAPTFTLSSSNPSAPAWAVLSEWSGAATSGVLDQHDAFTAATAVNPAADATNSNLAVAVWVLTGTKSATITNVHTWTPASGTASTIGTTGATKALQWMDAQAYLLNTHGGGAADQDVNGDVVSTGSLSSWTAQIASFKPAPPAVASPTQPITVGQAVQRAATRMQADEVEGERRNWWRPRLWLPSRPVGVAYLGA